MKAMKGMSIVTRCLNQCQCKRDLEKGLQGWYDSWVGSALGGLSSLPLASCGLKQPSAWLKVDKFWQLWDRLHILNFQEE